MIALDTSYIHADHHARHKCLAATWCDAETAASSATVYLGDKKKGFDHYASFCASYVPDMESGYGSGTRGNRETARMNRVYDKTRLWCYDACVKNREPRIQLYTTHYCQVPNLRPEVLDLPPPKTSVPNVRPAGAKCKS